MTAIQQVLWELRMDYIGHPYYVSGNAILHALGQHLRWPAFVTVIRYRTSPNPVW